MMFRGWFIILQTLNVAARFEKSNVQCRISTCDGFLQRLGPRDDGKPDFKHVAFNYSFIRLLLPPSVSGKKTKPQNHSSTAKEWSGIAVANHQKVTFSRRPMFQDILLKWNQWALQRIFESPVCFCGCTTILCIRCLATPWFLTKKQFTWFGSALWKPNQIGLPGRNALMCGTNKRSQLSSNWRIQSETFSGS